MKGQSKQAARSGAAQDTPGFQGATQGNFAVQPDGGASYSISLRVPPGTAKMQPKLSVGYDSSAGNGMLGVGFSLSGLSAISRVGATPAQDGFWSAVSFGENDRLALDGERLMAISGASYFDPAASYHTERESWQKVVPSYEGAPSSQQGPVTFTVYRKDGSVYRYGAAPGDGSNASVPTSQTNPSVRVWSLASITDANGNSLSITYELDAANNINYPSRISYTTNTGLTATRAVQFNYGAPGSSTPVVRSDPFTHYVGGNPVTTTRLLQSIQTLVDGAPVTTYSFGYGYGQQTGRAQLLSITETGADGTSLAPTLFTWQDGAPGMDTASAASLSASTPWTGLLLPMDVDGNGLVDVVSASASSGKLALTLLQSTGEDLTNAGSLLGDAQIPFTVGTPLLPMDVDGDGSMDLVVASSSGGNLALTVLLAEQLSSGGWALNVSGGVGTAGPTGIPSGGPLVSLDVNGDGLADLVCAYSQGGTLALQTLLSNGSGFTAPSPALIAQGVPFYSGATLTPLDFNGDSQTDLLYTWQSGQTLGAELFLSNGTGFTSAGNPFSSAPGYSGTLLSVDLNGDGKGDLVQVALASGKLQVQTWFSTGTAFVAGTSQTFDLGNFGTALPRLLPADVNGDGLPDLVVSWQSGSGVQMAVLLNNGNTFTLGATGSPSASLVPGAAQLLPMDLNGDGKTELVSAVSNAGTAAFALVPTSGPFPDLVTQIQNGLGGTVSVTYAPLTDADVYTKDAPPGGPPGISTRSLLTNRVSGAAYTVGSNSPVIAGSTRATQVADFPKYLVAQYTKTPGGSAASSQQSYTWTHHYTSALLDLTGRGWLGFGEIDVVDMDAGTRSATTYNQLFPQTGAPATLTISSAQEATSGKLMKQMTFGYTPLVNAPNTGPGVWQVQSTQVTTAFYTFADPSAPVADGTLSRTQTYDDFGNLKSVQETGDAFAAPVYVWLEYLNDADSWRFGDITQQTTTADAAASQVLAQRSFTYDTNRNVLSVSDLVEASSSEEVTVTYAYDSYGNCISKTDPTGAATLFQLDPTFTFTTQVTSPDNGQGGTLVLTTQFDPRFGEWTTSTDANGVVTTHVLDGFGRVSQVIGPDPNNQPTVLRTYGWGQDTNGIYQLLQQRVDWSGTLTWQRQYLDGFGRIWRTAALGPDGESVKLTDTVYSSRNAVLQQTMPYYNGDTAFAQVQNQYDPYQRLVSSQRVSSTGTVTTLYSYPSTNQTIRTDAAGTAQARTTTLQAIAYAGTRRMTSRTDSAGAVTTFQYDPLGRMTGITDPLGVTTSFTYDSLGRRTSAQAANTERTFFAVKTDYQTADRKITQTDALGNQVISSYEPLGRLAQRTVQPAGGGAAQVTTFTFDDAKTPYAQGRISSVAMPDGSSYAYAYDPTGNRTTVTVSIAGGTAHTFSRAYTPLRRPSQINFPDGTQQSFQFNPAGVLTGVSYSDTANNTVSTIYGGFTPFGHPQQVSCGNGVTEAWSYDDLGRVTGIGVSGPQGALVGLGYTYDPFDAIGTIDDTLGDTTLESYTYDSVGRLQQAVGPYGTLTFGYDAGGNLTQKDGITYTSQGYQVVQGTSGDQTVFSAGYDANGNMTSAVRGGVTTTYQWDGLNQLTAAGGLQFSYDYTGRRMSKVLSDGSSVLEVSPQYRLYQESGQSEGAAQQVKFIAGRGGPIASVGSAQDATVPPGTPPPGVAYLHKNHLGSAILQTDANGNPLVRLQYQPFGQLASSGGTDTVTQKFTGKELDAELQLYFFGARYYDPGIGRFISHDIGQGGDLLRSDAFHAYAYGTNDPINFVDPDGHGAILNWLKSHWKAIVSYTVDGLLIIGGLAVSALTFGGASLIGGALIGAGVQGLVENVTDSVEGKQVNLASWGEQLGVGAVFGLATAGAGEVLGALAKGVGGQIASLAGKEATSELGQFMVSAAQKAESFAQNAVVRLAGAAVKEAVANSIGSGVSTITGNLIAKQPWDAGLGSSMLLGFAAGAVAGGAAKVAGDALSSGFLLNEAKGDISAMDSSLNSDSVSNAKSLDELKASNPDPRVQSVVETYQKIARVYNALPGMFFENFVQDPGEVAWHPW